MQTGATRAVGSVFVSVLAGACIAAWMGAFGGIGCKGARSACCRIRVMCDHCSCSSALERIGDADDQAACRDALEDDDIADGCPVYPGDRAIDECRGMRAADSVHLELEPHDSETSLDTDEEELTTTNTTGP